MFNRIAIGVWLSSLLFICGCSHSVNTVGVSGTYDPSTGGVGVGVEVGIKTRAGDNPCNRSIESRFRNFFSMGRCPELVPAPQPIVSQPPVLPTDPTSSGQDAVPPPQISTNPSAVDEAIIAQVLTNGESELTTGENSDRAVVFGNNYPGTSAQLGECVYDAKRNVTNLVKLCGFNPKNIRLFTDRQCTAANYRKWVVWSLDTTGRSFVGNSSHGSQDVINGKVTGIICTWDMISTGDWSPEHEISFEWWGTTLRAAKNNFLDFSDSCYSGGLVRPLVGPSNRRIRSLAPALAAQKRIDDAVARGESMRSTPLPGVVITACADNELSEEAQGEGGFGTSALWYAWASLGQANPKSSDIVRACNKYLRSRAVTQHQQLIGQNVPIWSKLP